MLYQKGKLSFVCKIDDTDIRKGRINDSLKRTNRYSKWRRLYRTDRSIDLTTMPCPLCRTNLLYQSISSTIIKFTKLFCIECSRYFHRLILMLENCSLYILYELCETSWRWFPRMLQLINQKIIKSIEKCRNVEEAFIANTNKYDKARIVIWNACMIATNIF